MKNDYSFIVFLKISIIVLIVTIFGITNIYADTITYSDTIQGELSGEWQYGDGTDGYWGEWITVNDVGVTQFNVNGFNSNLGTLDEIQFSLDVTVSGSVTFEGSATTEDGGTFTRYTWGQINLLGTGFPLWANAQTETWSMNLTTALQTGEGIFAPVQSTATASLSDSNSFNPYIDSGIISIDASRALNPGGELVNGGGNIRVYSNIVTGALDVTYIYTPSIGETAPVPEPATMLLFGLGLLGLAGVSRKKK